MCKPNNRVGIQGQDSIKDFIDKNYNKNVMEVVALKVKVNLKVLFQKNIVVRSNKEDYCTGTTLVEVKEKI